MFYTYILQSATTGLIYIGQTSNLEQRIIRHNSGGSNYTKGKGHWEMLFSIEFKTRSEAMELERKLKGFKNSKKVLIWVERHYGFKGRPDS